MRHTAAARVRYRGDARVGALFLGRARVVLGMLLHRMKLGGVTAGVNEQIDANGVRYRASFGGVVPIVEIDVRRLDRRLLQDVVWAFVFNRGANTVSVVDVDRGKITKTISGLGPITAMAAAPDGRHVYFGTVLGGLGYLVRLDVAGVLVGDLSSAYGVAYDSVFRASSLSVSADSRRLYAHYQPAPIVGGDPRGGYVTHDTETMGQLANLPNDIAGAYSFSTEAGELLYITSLVPDPEGPGETWQDYVPQVEVFASDLPSLARVATLELVDLRPSVAAGGYSFIEVRANRSGSRIYSASLRDGMLTGSGTEAIPSFISMAIDGEGGVSQIHARTFGATTGSLAVSHSGNRVYLADKNGMALVVDTAEDADAIVASFPFQPAASVAYPAERGNRIHVGPYAGVEPDNRIYYLSPEAYTLWVFHPGGEEPALQIDLATGADMFVLCKHGARLKASP